MVLVNSRPRMTRGFCYAVDLECPVPIFIGSHPSYEGRPPTYRSSRFDAPLWYRALAFADLSKLCLGDTITGLSCHHLYPRPFLLGLSAVSDLSSAAAARALSGQEDLSAEEVARKSMEVRSLLAALPSLVDGVGGAPWGGRSIPRDTAVATYTRPSRFFMSPGVFPGVARCSCA